MKVGMAWFYRTTTLPAMRPALHALALVLAGALIAPVAAGGATLQPLKPCYVSVSKDEREQVVLAGSMFTPGAVLDILLDGEKVAEAVADANGAFGPQAILAPHQPRRDGVRAFDVAVVERANPANRVDARSLVTPLAASLRPTPRRPGEKVTWRGRGFTGKGKVYAHYVRKGRHRRTVALTRPSGPCGFFRTRARQFPFKPKVGRWVVRLDQQRRWTRRPRGIFWEFEVFVRRAG